MPRPRTPGRECTSIRLSKENNEWLDEVKAATGESRSDITNRAIAALRDEGRIKELLREVLAEERNR